MLGTKRLCLELTMLMKSEVKTVKLDDEFKVLILMLVIFQRVLIVESLRTEELHAHNTTQCTDEPEI